MLFDSFVDLTFDTCTINENDGDYLIAAKLVVTSCLIIVYLITTILMKVLYILMAILMLILHSIHQILQIQQL